MTKHPLGRALFTEPEMVNERWRRLEPLPTLVPGKSEVEAPWRAAATKLGIPYEEYALHRGRGERWCSPGQHWTTEPGKGHRCSRHYQDGQSGRRTKGGEHDEHRLE